MNSDDNSIADQDNFSSKKKIYAKSKIQITQTLSNESKWDAEDIDNRQQELAKLAAKRWAI